MSSYLLDTTLVILGQFIHAHWAEPRFALPAMALHVWVMAYVVTSIRQMVMGLQIDFDKPVTGAMIDISAPVAITWPTGAKSSWTTGKPKTPTRAPHLNSRVTNQASRQASSDSGVNCPVRELPGLGTFSIRMQNRAASASTRIVCVLRSSVGSAQIVTSVR